MPERPGYTVHAATAVPAHECSSEENMIRNNASIAMSRHAENEQAKGQAGGAAAGEPHRVPPVEK